MKLSVFKKLQKYFKNLLNIKCTHSSAKMKNCKYCPDCGKKIVHKWIVIKCRLCGHYRKPLIDLFEKIKPVKKYCFHCGSDKWGYQYYYESFIPDRMKLISVKKIQTEKEYNNKFGALTENTKIWISNSSCENSNK